MQIHQAILDAIEEGVQIEVRKTELGMCFDMQTGSKSEMHIYQREDGKLDVHQRYDQKTVAETFDDLCHLVVDGMCNKDGLVWYWRDILKARGYLD